MKKIFTKIAVLALIAASFIGCDQKPQRTGYSDLHRHAIYGPVKTITERYHGGESAEDSVLAYEVLQISKDGFITRTDMYHANGKPVRSRVFDYYAEGLERASVLDSNGVERAYAIVEYCPARQNVTEMIKAHDGLTSRTTTHKYGADGLLDHSTLLDSLGGIVEHRVYEHDSQSNRTGKVIISSDSIELSNIKYTYSKPDSLGNWTQKEKRFRVNNRCIYFITRTLEYYQ